MTATDGELLVHIVDGIAHVTLNRPQSRNALTFGMYEELAKLCALKRDVYSKALKQLAVFIEI